MYDDNNLEMALRLQFLTDPFIKIGDKNKIFHAFSQFISRYFPTKKSDDALVLYFQFFLEKYFRK